MNNIKNIKKINAIFFLLGMLGIFSVNSFAQAPANDNFASAEQLTGIRVSVTRSNVGATKEVGERDHGGNSGGKSVWFRWTAPMTRLMRFTTNRSATNIDTLLHVWEGNTLVTLESRAGHNDINNPVNNRSFARFLVTAGVTYYIAVDGFKSGTQPAAEGTFALDIHPSLQFQGADYDNDGMTDLSVFRPSTGEWFVRQSSDGGTMRTVYWGTNGDMPVISARNGNGPNDFTVFRPSDNIWYRRAASGISYTYWGISGDKPVSDQFGGSEASEHAVYRPSTGEWFLYYNELSYRHYRFGGAEDIPVPGQYSADRYADLAVFRPSTGTWYFLIRQSNDPDAQDLYKTVRWGLAGDKPVPADYDGDGILDIAVYRPSTGVWYVLRSSDNQSQYAYLGLPDDIPTTGDFNGDGLFDFAVYRPSNGVWYIAHSTTSGAPQPYVPYYFGQNGDIPVTSNNGR